MTVSPFQHNGGITAIKSGEYEKVTRTTLNTITLWLLFSKKLLARFPDISGVEIEMLAKKAVNKMQSKLYKHVDECLEVLGRNKGLNSDIFKYEA